MKGFMRALVVALIVAMSGCVSTPLQRDIDDHVATANQDATELVARAVDVKESYYVEHDEPYISAHAIGISKTADEPEFLRRNVTLRRQYPVTLQQVAEFLATGNSIPVAVTRDAIESAVTAAVDPLTQQLPPPQNAAAGQITPGAFYLQYEGTVKGLLDLVAARTANSWAYRAGKIVLYHRDTRTFHVEVIPGDSRLTSTITNVSGTSSDAGEAGARGGTEASSGQTTEMSVDLKLFDTVALTVQNMLSEGAKSTASPSTNTITVTDTPEVLDRIDAYIDELNARMTRLVSLHVRVYSVDIEDAENYAVNWEAIYRSMSGSIGVDALSLGNAPDDAQSIAVSVIDEGSNYAGSSLLLQALAKQGTVAVQTSVPVVTLSGQPVPVQIASQTSYLAKVETTLVQDAGALETITPGSVTTGFSLACLPVVLDNNDVLVQVQTTLSSLRQLREITADASGRGNRIEAPEVDSRDFMQRVRLKSNQTLVLAGFESDRFATDRRGIGSPKFQVAGGGTNAERKRTVLVVLVTPRVMG